MKPLTLEETALKEEMKERCLAKGQYIDEKAKDKFKMLCHLEDFEIQYWKLEQQCKKQKEVIDKAINWIIKYQTEWCQEDEVIRDLKQLLDILKGVSNNE